MRRTIGTAGAVVLAVHLGPAATWLPTIRRWLTPSLQGPRSPGSIALTFDDGPHPEGTLAVLGALDDQRWPATFFLLGSEARRYPDVVKEIVARGHEVAVHGDQHRYLIARTPLAAADDLRRAVDTVGEIAGRTPRWWRPPYGVLSGPALAAARRLGLRPVLWSAWGRDWRADATPDSVVAELSARPLDGATLLLHDSDVTSAPGSWRTTAAAMPLLAQRIVSAGLVPETLSAMSQA